MDARQAAVATLIAYRREGAWSEAYLKKMIKANDMSQRDAALASIICYGVLQNSILLDFYIDNFSTVKKINPKIRDILRVGVYQILWLDRVPVSAAVNEAVKMARKDNPKAAGFVNALLRRIAASKSSLPEPIGDKAYRLSVSTSHPQWLVGMFLKIFGDSAEDILRANNIAPEITARVNTVKGDVQGAIESLTSQGVEACAHEWLPKCVVLKNPGSLEELSAFKSGLITVQDTASQIAAMCVGAKPGMRVLDACAAPGGKSFVLAQEMENKGEVVSCDIHPHKINILEKGAQRLGLDCINATLKDASEFDAVFEKSFDAVLADVPCSGLGIIRKKPDIRYKDPDELKALPEIQKKILSNVSSYVKPGGVLVYSTCTVIPRENRKVIDAFLAENADFKLENFEICGLGECAPGDVTLLPSVHGTDGFYICKLRREQ